MTFDMPRFILKLKSVRDACRIAPESPWKDAALEYYRAAEKEHSAQREAAADRELDAAMDALATGRLSAKSSDAASPGRPGNHLSPRGANELAGFQRMFLEIRGS